MLLDPDLNWGDPASLYWEKVGDLRPWSGNDSTSSGTWLEHALLAFAESWTGTTVFDRGRRYEDTSYGYPRHATVDGVCRWEGKFWVVEAKASMVYHDEFGDEETDELPKRVVIQALHNMDVLDSCLPEKESLVGGTLVPHVGPGLKFSMFKVPFDMETQDQIRNREKKFWLDHVIAKVPPEATDKVREVLVRARREPDTLALVDPELLELREEYKAQIKELEKRASTIEAAIRARAMDPETNKIAAVVQADGHPKEVRFHEVEKKYLGRGNGFEDCCPTCGVGVRISRTTKWTNAKTAQHPNARLIEGRAGVSPAIDK